MKLRPALDYGLVLSGFAAGLVVIAYAGFRLLALVWTGR